jgi:hypothetical protein
MDKQKKVAQFQLADLSTAALTLIVVGLIIAFGLSIVASVSSTFTANSSEKNATLKTVEGITVFSDKLPTIALVIVGALLIGMLVNYFMGAGSR